MPERGEVVRHRIVFHGRVQGVGFRATAQQLASRRDVVGYVRNQADGTVELEAEGVLHEVDALVDSINEHMSRNIRDVDRQSLDPRADEERFEIRY